MHLLNWADYTIIGIVCLSTLIGLARGFVREILSLATWIVAFLLAFEFCDNLAQFFTSYISNSSFRVAVAFAVLFGATLLLGSLFNYLLTHLVTKSSMKGPDRILGMVFGFARGILVIAVVLLLFSLNNEKDDWQNKSYFVPRFQVLVDWLHGFLPQKIKEEIPEKNPDLSIN